HGVSRLATQRLRDRRERECRRRFGLHLMNAEQLVDAARERCGLSDFGTDTWQEGLDVLVRALHDEAQLNELGAAAMTDQIVGNLVNRLKIEQAYSQHPEIDDERIVAPLFGLGLPRT